MGPQLRGEGDPPGGGSVRRIRGVPVAGGQESGRGRPLRRRLPPADLRRHHRDHARPGRRGIDLGLRGHRPRHPGHRAADRGDLLAGDPGADRDLDPRVLWHCREAGAGRLCGDRAGGRVRCLLDDCTIPLENVLGGVEKLEGKLARAREGTHSRSSVALKTFELSRPIVGAQALGIARAAFEFALQYAKERKQFGRPLIDNQAIAFMLADMATEIEATRALIWRALWEGRSGGEFKKAEGSMAKLKAGEVAVKVTDQAIQICGGYGYIRDFPVEKWHRDAKIYTLFEGTSEIQRLVISRAIAHD